MISSTGKQWPSLVGFDSVHSTAGVNGMQQKRTPSLSAKVTSNKHCKQGGGHLTETQNQRAGVYTLGLHHFTCRLGGSHFGTQQQPSNVQ